MYSQSGILEKNLILFSFGLGQPPTVDDEVTEQRIQSSDKDSVSIREEYLNSNSVSVQDSASSSDSEKNSSSSSSEAEDDQASSKDDARKYSRDKYKRQFSWLYYNSGKNGYLCKVCEIFPPLLQTGGQN